MRVYKALKKQEFKIGDYCLTPIRHEDRFKIMKWRNEQIYHLRQTKPLTEEIQDKYFTNIIANLFEQERPGQILFSFLKGEECVGYGGLVHLNWLSRNAEVSFVMDTSMEKQQFQEFWIYFLRLIEAVAFNEMGLHKIFTFAFDLRPKLYRSLEICEFNYEARLKEHVLVQGNYVDVVIHSKINTPSG